MINGSVLDPDERAGLVMVFRTYDKVSYALVMEALRPLHVFDRVTRRPLSLQSMVSIRNAGGAFGTVACNVCVPARSDTTASPSSGYRSRTVTSA